MDRRGFLKLMGVASGTSMLAGCDIERQSEKLIPYLVPPEDELLPGEHRFVATSCTECPAQCGISARIVEDRPVKVDGLDGHPVNGGALCVRGQASINRLYLPERIRQPLMQDGNGNLVPGTWNQVFARIVEAMGEVGGEKLYWSGRTTGSVSVLTDEFCNRMSLRRLPEFEVFSHAAIRQANREMFGRRDVPWYRVDEADFVLSVGADLMGTFQNPVANIAAITRNRRDDRFKWYHAEPHATLSGFQATTRLGVRPGGESHLLAFLLHEFRARRVIADGALDRIVGSVPRVDVNAASAATGVDRAMLEEMVDDFMGASKPLVVAGEVSTAGDRGLEVARLVALVQAVSGMVGSTVDFAAAPDYRRVGSMSDVRDLMSRLDAGGVGVLFVADTDPVGLLDNGDELSAAMSKAGFIVGIGDTLTDTMNKCDVVLPLSHPLESWGDVEPRAGVVGVVQPAFEPIFDTLSLGDVLLRLMKEAGRTVPAPDYQQYVMARWERQYNSTRARQLVEQGWTEVPAGRSQPSFTGRSRPAWGFADTDTRAAALVVAPSHRWFDGRSADLPLLKEVPDPLSSVTWDDWVSVSPSTAKSLGVEDRSELELSGSGWSAKLPVRIQPGVADDVFAVQCGIGRFPLGWSQQSGELNAVALGITARATSKRIPMAILAGALGDQGRGVVPGHEVYHFAPELQHHGKVEHEQEEISFYKEPEYVDYRWAMAVDMDLCVGCGACVTACYIENNVPMVGRDEHLKGREMSWIRIEPYYFDDGHADFVPAMCQHCDYAPCEPVCPVFAAYTNEQGLAVQVYNRCVGTRYCSNNCPFKQRRFNWFDWSERPEPMNMMVNPDVSTRDKGIMEKCSFCYQRIRRARDEAKNEGRKIEEGDFTTACAQACPGNAIAFGNLLDENSRIAQWAKSGRSTRLLEEIGVGPAVYYLSDKSKHAHNGNGHGNGHDDHSEGEGNGAH